MNSATIATISAGEGREMRRVKADTAGLLGPLIDVRSTGRPPFLTAASRTPRKSRSRNRTAAAGYWHERTSTTEGRMTLQDEELARRAAAGDHASFAELYDR